MHEVGSISIRFPYHPSAEMLYHVMAFLAMVWKLEQCYVLANATFVNDMAMLSVQSVEHYQLHAYSINEVKLAVEHNIATASISSLCMS